MGDSTILIPKFRGDPYGCSRSSFRSGITFPRYWKSRETGVVVEVQRVFLVDGMRIQFIYHHPVWGHSVSASLEEMNRCYEPYGNMSAQF